MGLGDCVAAGIFASIMRPPFKGVSRACSYAVHSTLLGGGDGVVLAVTGLNMMVRLPLSFYSYAPAVLAVDAQVVAVEQPHTYEGRGVGGFSQNVSYTNSF